jgi:hypothetical protein
MSLLHYKIVPHDGGFAYTLGGVFSEPFRTHDAALKAARRVAHEQSVPGEEAYIQYETEAGEWVSEHVRGGDRPLADVEE